MMRREGNAILMIMIWSSAGSRWNRVKLPLAFWIASRAQACAGEDSIELQSILARFEKLNMEKFRRMTGRYNGYRVELLFD